MAEKHESKVDIEDAPTTARITSDGSATPMETVSSVQTSDRVEQSLGAALELQNRVTNLLAPLQGALGAPGGWEHAAAAARLRSKRDKIRRNRKWRKRKRQRIAEARRKVCRSRYSCSRDGPSLSVHYLHFEGLLLV